MRIQIGLSCESRGKQDHHQPHAAPAQKSYGPVPSPTYGTDLGLPSVLILLIFHKTATTALHVLKTMTRMRQLLLLVLIILWTVSGAFGDSGIYLAPICNVTETSGLTTDCAQIISYLQFLGRADCCVHEHNQCTTMRAFGTCRARICTLPFVPLPRCQPCGMVAEYVRNLANLCAEPVLGESRSGGFQVMKEDSSLYIVLY